MNNTDLKSIQQSQAHEQEQLVGYWVKRFGINRKDLTEHPQIDDIMLLIQFSREFPDMNNYQQERFDRVWRWVYHHTLPLKAKHYQSLYRTGTTIRRWRKKRSKAGEIIKARRG